MTLQTSTIQFWHRGAVQTVNDVATDFTVLQWLRTHAACNGTKEGCAEGDCGACTVVVGSLDDRQALRLKAVNACIQFVPTLQGKALYSVEDVKLDNGTLHPVQQALQECHGSQCGFCTPGFVMSLWSLYNQAEDGANKNLSRDEIENTLSGNLCRCTGYRPIIDAAQKMTTYPQARFDTQPAVAALQAINNGQDFSYHDGKNGFYAPSSIESLAALRLAKPQARLLAGGTDIGLWVTKQFRELGDLIFIGNVKALQTVQYDAQGITIPAAVGLNEAFAALTTTFPELSTLARRFASMPIRNSGTLVGNVANASPIGDSMPALITLGTQIVLQRGDGVREMPLEDYYIAYGKTALKEGEFVRAIRIPPRVASLQVRTYKISKRFDQDISAVCAAFSLQLDAAGTISQARVAFGGMAATPKRGTHIEQALNGQVWNEATVTQAMAQLDSDYQPLSDMRASDAYRRQAAKNMLRRFWLETRLDAPLPASVVDVFSAAAAMEGV